VLWISEISVKQLLQAKMENIFEALVKICLLKPEFFICSFPGKIIIGQPKKSILYEDTSFTIFRCDYALFFKALSDICIVIAGENYEDLNVTPNNKRSKIEAQGILLKKVPIAYTFGKLRIILLS